jgi:PKD repeat protein
VAGGTPNLPPVAVASASPASGTAPLAVAFSGAGSSDPDGFIASHAWAFGDGTTGSGVTASHTYVNAGSYTATLTVTDNRGATKSIAVGITATGDINAIAAPGNLSASAPKPGSVSLRWTDNSTNEQGFYVERAPAGSAAFARVGQVGANITTFAQSKVASGQYAFRVQAFNTTTSRLSPYSNQVTVRIK